jgi:regulator of protease activity HflC (stomatin/prohibitin superfamily)
MGGREVEPVAVAMPDPQVGERLRTGGPGWAILGVVVVAGLGGIATVVAALAVADRDDTLPAPAAIVAGLLLVIISGVLGAGLTPVNPGQARVLQLLGRYTGTVRTTGLRWVNPLTKRTQISTRIRNHETDVAKVNDLDGSPIEIAAVVVWQVEDTAKASFEVDNFVEFVAIQSETAVRHIANSYPYDAPDDQLSLRDNADEITRKLSAEIAARVESAGVRVIESRITHLAYAPEIAQAMLRRQQAGAVVAARQRIVDGAVGMVETALGRLEQDDVVHLDEERKAAMVSNLLVVLCSEQATHPVVNAGSLYQ